MVMRRTFHQDSCTELCDSKITVNIGYTLIMKVDISDPFLLKCYGIVPKSTCPLLVARNTLWIW